MTDQEVIEELKSRLLGLNRVLDSAHQLDITVTLNTVHQGVLGKSAPLVHVEGRAVKQKVQFVEPL